MKLTIEGTTDEIQKVLQDIAGSEEHKRDAAELLPVNSSRIRQQEILLEDCMSNFQHNSEQS